jgi:hypothetical protein
MFEDLSNINPLYIILGFCVLLIIVLVVLYFKKKSNPCPGDGSCGSDSCPQCASNTCLNCGQDTNTNCTDQGCNSTCPTCPGNDCSKCPPTNDCSKCNSVTVPAGNYYGTTLPNTTSGPINYHPDNNGGATCNNWCKGDPNSIGASWAYSLPDKKFVPTDVLTPGKILLCGCQQKN